MISMTLTVININNGKIPKKNHPMIIERIVTTTAIIITTTTTATFLHQMTMINDIRRIMLQEASADINELLRSGRRNSQKANGS